MNFKQELKQFSLDKEVFEIKTKARNNFELKILFQSKQNNEQKIPPQPTNHSISEFNQSSPKEMPRSSSSPRSNLSFCPRGRGADSARLRKLERDYKREKERKRRKREREGDRDAEERGVGGKEKPPLERKREAV